MLRAGKAIAFLSLPESITENTVHGVYFYRDLEYLLACHSILCPPRITRVQSSQPSWPDGQQPRRVHGSSDKGRGRSASIGELTGYKSPEISTISRYTIEPSVQDHDIHTSSSILSPEWLLPVRGARV